MTLKIVHRITRVPAKNLCYAKVFSCVVGHSVSNQQYFFQCLLIRIVVCVFSLMWVLYYTTRDSVPIIRRHTGGGTVVVDSGTVFVSLIMNVRHNGYWLCVWLIHLLSSTISFYNIIFHWTARLSELDIILFYFTRRNPPSLFPRTPETSWSGPRRPFTNPYSGQQMPYPIYRLYIHSFPILFYW